MSAAANAAGYLYARGQLPVSELNARGDSVRTPRIEYRKRRVYALPSAA